MRCEVWNTLACATWADGSSTTADMSSARSTKREPYAHGRFLSTGWCRSTPAGEDHPLRSERPLHEGAVRPSFKQGHATRRQHGHHMSALQVQDARHERRNEPILGP